MSANASRRTALHGGSDGASVRPDAGHFNTEETEAARRSRKAFELRFAPLDGLREAREFSFRGLRAASVSSVLDSSIILPATPP